MFLIPMAGRSSRFYNAGYSVPKYRLMLAGGSVFDQAVGSFAAYFETDFFRFVVRADDGAADFVPDAARRLGIRDFDLLVLERETAGQAETVSLGLAGLSAQEPVYIFNIDTFRPGFRKACQGCDGYLEVFEAPGDHWSFVEPGPDGRVLRTTEKDRISNLCSDGLYYFRTPALFEDAYIQARESGASVKGEYFVAPLYNHLIGAGRDVRYTVVPRQEVILCGTPAEYQAIGGQHP